MTDTAKDICQQALLRIGFDAPSTFSNSSDATSRQVWALLRQVDNDVKQAGEWQQLRKEFTFSTLAAEQQLDFNSVTDFPDQDFGRFCNQTMYNRSQQYPILGPLTPSQWQRRKATVIGNIRYWFTVRGAKILFMTTPPAGQTIVFEYISKNFWETTLGVGLEYPTSDTDTPVLESEIYILGLKWRWLHAKGLEYAEALRDFQYCIEQKIGEQDPAPVLDQAGLGLGLSPPRIPEGSWPG